MTVATPLGGVLGPPLLTVISELRCMDDDGESLTMVPATVSFFTLRVLPTGARCSIHSRLFKYKRATCDTYYRHLLRQRHHRIGTFQQSIRSLSTNFWENISIRVYLNLSLYIYRLEAQDVHSEVHYAAVQ